MRQPTDAPTPPALAPPVPGAPPAPLLGLTRDEIALAVTPWVDRPYRAEQLFRAIYERGVEDLEAITDLPGTLRRSLAVRWSVGVPEVAGSETSGDGTRKFLLRLSDGATVEAVDIPDGDRRTLCLSSQAGCALGCRFCVTGYWGAGRDLSAGEIVGQVLRLAGGLGQRRRLNLVFMGMGEPMLNLDAVRRALELLAPWISPRRVTVSTVGVVPGIEAMASWPRRPNLAISLHAPDSERRRKLMPVESRYPLPALMAALAAYPLEPRRRITFEYLLIRGFNDALGDADELARLLRPLPAKVNLIPLNPDPVQPPGMEPPAEEVVAAFQERLLARGLLTTVRRRRGGDVAAACGQLRAFGRDPRGFRLRSVSW